MKNDASSKCDIYIVAFSAVNTYRSVERFVKKDFLTSLALNAAGYRKAYVNE